MKSVGKIKIMPKMFWWKNRFDPKIPCDACGDRPMAYEEWVGYPITVYPVCPKCGAIAKDDEEIS